ncbi:MAG: 6-phosphofructokinase [Candidatus Omnitrophica bacterium]|nr:6-phosphofructokinase [Candidatus Omnitrophota bacterium]
MKRVGVLTGGGDSPGLNSVIRAVTRRALAAGYEVIGLKNGWKGLVDGLTVSLDLASVSGILPKGGTILGTSRTNLYAVPADHDRAVATYKQLQLEGLIVIGGEDTLGVANKLSQEGLHIVAVPKTIDNDLANTDFTFGFDTAVNIATEAIDRLLTTAESHHRIMVVEVMGRHAGWIATYAGIAGGADVILIPEKPIDVHEVCDILRKRHARGKEFSIVVVAEGAALDHQSEVAKAEKLDAFGHIRLGGIGDTLGKLIEEQTGIETRVTVLGHIQRGGSPTAFDRVLGTRFGVAAMELVLSRDFGKMVSLQGNKIVAIPIASAVAQLKTVDPELYEIAKIFFG